MIYPIIRNRHLYWVYGDYAFESLWLLVTDLIEVKK